MARLVIKVSLVNKKYVVVSIITTYTGTCKVFFFLLFSNILSVKQICSTNQGAVKISSHCYWQGVISHSFFVSKCSTIRPYVDFIYIYIALHVFVSKRFLNKLTETFL